MPLSIRIISSPPGEAVSEWNKFFPEEGGSIGRGYDAHLQLSDAKKEISATHAIIRKTSRGYQVMDNSTNGLFINGKDKPLGKGNSAILDDGDIFAIGGYQLLVSCFLSLEAQKSSSKSEKTLTLYADDPFTALEMESGSEKKRATLLTIDNNSDIDLVISNPFINNIAPQQVVEKDITLDFKDLDDALPIECDLNHPLAIDVQLSDNAFSPMVITERKQYVSEQQRIDHALELALGKLLEDISPVVIESLLNDISPPSFWQRKNNYWDMYKRYFNHQMVNGDWKLKFHSYFHAALKMQHERNGDK